MKKLPGLQLKIMTRLNLLSVGIILVMTVCVLGAGVIIITGVLYRFQERVLRLELDNARQQIIQTLHRSGMRAATLKASEVQNALQQKEGLETSRLYVIDHVGRRIVFHPTIPAGQEIKADFTVEMLERQAGTIEYLYDVPRLAVFTTVSPLNWLIGLSITKAEMLAKQIEFLWITGGITFAVLFLNALLINHFGRRLLARIKTALDCVHQIENGDLSARIAPNALRDEVGVLQEGINAMAMGLETRTQAQQKAEYALRENRALLQSILDNSPAVIFVKDVEGHYLLVNRRYTEMFHVSIEDLVGKTIFDIFPREQAEPILAAEMKAINERCEVKGEDVVTQDDGQHTYLGIKYPLYDAAGEPYAVCGISTDITELKRAEADRQARGAAEAANKAKSEFLSAMSHELRTPLNAILGYAQLLKRNTGLSEQHVSSLEVIEQSGRHLLTLINDLLDLAKIEARKLDLVPASVDLAACLQMVADIIRVRVEEKSLLFMLDTASDLPKGVTVDEKRLRQVLLNLLSNAVKFTDRGGVTLRVQCLQRKGGIALLRFEVADTGVGMTAEQLKSIFQPFEQVGDLRRRSSGTGLGLSISRQLVQLMGGDIGVESQPDAGSRFWFDIPVPELDIDITATMAGWEATGYQGPRRKILIVEDSAGNRAMLAELLAAMGFDLYEAADGEQAVEQARIWLPDLVVMDMVLPEMNGMEAIYRIRQIPGMAQVPIIAVSSSANHAELENSLDAGASAFIVKPIDRRKLLEKIGEYLKLSWITAERESESSYNQRKPIEAVPPMDEMRVLHEQAKAGNMRAIREWSDAIAARDDRYAPFAEQLRGLARNYQSRAIVELVEQYLPEDSLP